MDPIAHAARLNSEGVLLLNEGADQESARALTEALSIMQSELVQSTQKGPDQGLAPRGSIEFAESISMVASSSHFIFNRGIYFDSSNTATKDAEESSLLHLYSAAIIFNLALLYHKRALLHNNANCFRKADDLYRKITMILGWPNSDQATLSGATAVILVAAINNMSHIRYEQGHYELAEEGLRALAHILQTTSSTLQVPGSGVSPSGDFWNQIVLNVLLLKQPSLAAAA
jgi:tetratricopeptide (TPR) repeat protein